MRNCKLHLADEGDRRRRYRSADLCGGGQQL